MSNKDIIHLNVGGTKYTTTKSTLRRFPKSMLGAMFTGNLPVTTDKDGYYFIDRCGYIFEYILQFLRSGKLILPNNFSDIELLQCEVDFYQIEELKVAVKDYTEKRNKNVEANDGKTLLYCMFRGHNLEGKSFIDYGIYTKSKYTKFEKRNDISYGKLLNLNSLKTYLQNNGWVLKDSAKLKIEEAPAFFLTEGIEGNPFLKNVTYNAVDIEIWVQKPGST